MQKRIFKISFLSSIGVLLYISIVASVMQYAEKIIGEPNVYIGPVMFLMLFVFSALMMGLLILGYPIWLYLEGKKTDAVKLLLYTVGWLFIILILIFSIGYYTA